MSQPTEMPWVGSPTANLSLSDPRCDNDSCHAFSDAHQLSQKLVPDGYEFHYGHFTTWYYLAWLGVFAVAYAIRRVTEWKQNRPRTNSSVDGTESSMSNKIHHETALNKTHARIAAMWRCFSYRRVSGWWSKVVGVPSMGLVSFLLLAALYLSILAFFKRPYLRPHHGYGSSPLGVRTGLMATALVPLTIALSGKANVIILLTGIGHERLNIVHRWVGYMIFALSVMHAIPFIAAPLKDGGVTALHKQVYQKGALEYTGVVPRAMLFGFNVLSTPWIRHRVHEGFYYVHFILAATFLGTLFWHARNEGDSWYYLWAALAIWLATFTARVFWYTRPTNIMQGDWFSGFPVSGLKTFPNDMTKLEILAPPNFRWSPGQHVFLRLPNIGPFDNHPFTIATADAPTTEEPTWRTMVFHVRSHSGFTRRLRKYVSGAVDSHLKAWVEGSYGGMYQDPGLRYDSILLVMAGSGISAGVPWVEHFARRFVEKDSSLRIKKLKMVWSMKERDSIKWVEETLSKVPWKILGGKICLHVHITSQVQELLEEEESERFSAYDEDCKQRTGMRNEQEIEKETQRVGEKSVQSKVRNEQSDTESTPHVEEKGIELQDMTHIKVHTPFNYHQGRINFVNLLAEPDSVPPSSRTLIIGCGPAPFITDLSNACAATQIRVFSSNSESPVEIALWTEAFGW